MSLLSSIGNTFLWRLSPVKVKPAGGTLGKAGVRKSCLCRRRGHGGWVGRGSQSKTVLSRKWPVESVLLPLIAALFPCQLSTLNLVKTSAIHCLNLVGKAVLMSVTKWTQISPFILFDRNQEPIRAGNNLISKKEATSLSNCAPSLFKGLAFWCKSNNKVLNIE